MDISDEELFDAPNCSTSTINTNLNLSEQTSDLTSDSKQEKDSNNATLKNILMKVTCLPKKERTNSHSKFKKRSFKWKFGQLSSKRKRVSSFVSSRSQQEFQKMESANEDRENEEMHAQLYNQSYEEELYGDDKENEQTAQSETQSFSSSTYQAQEEDSYANEVYTCARTIPYEFHKKVYRISDNGTIKNTTPSFLPSSSSKNTEPNLHSDKSYLFDCSSSNKKTKKKAKRLIRPRLTFTVKRMGKQLNEWKFRRKYVSSDSEDEEVSLRKKRCRRILFENEDTPVNNVEAIEDNNQSESHLSFEKTEKKKPNIQFNCTAQVILTRLEEMEDEDAIKWRQRRTTFSDVIASKSEAGQQLDQWKLGNLLTSESQNNLTLPKGDRILETRDTFKDLSLTTISSCVEKELCTTKSSLNKLRKKYKLFKKPRVLIIKLETLQCSSKDGRYSTTEIDYLTKKYVTFVINSNFQYKSRGLKMYKHVRLRRKSTIEDTAGDHNTSVSRRQSTSEILNPSFAEESSMKDMQSDENVPFKIHRKFTPIQNWDKSSSSEVFEKNSQKRLELWRNAFRESERSREKIIFAQSTSTSKTASVLQNLLQNSAKYDMNKISSLPSTSTSSTKHSTPVESLKILAPLKNQTEVSAKSTECNDTSTLESSIENLPSNANVEKIVLRSDFTQSKNSNVSKNQRKSTEKVDVIALNSALGDFLNSNIKTSHPEISPKLHEATGLKSSSDTSVKSKTSKGHSVEQSSRKTEETHICGMCDVCGRTFNNHDLFLKHLASSLNKTCAAVSPTSGNASKSVKASTLNQTIVNTKYNQNLKNSTLQEQCSVNEEDHLHQLDKSSSDLKIMSCFSSSSSSRGLRTRRSSKKIRTRSTTKSNLRSSKHRTEILKSRNVKISKNVKLKRTEACKICLRAFDTYGQLLQHIFKHMSHDLRNMYASIENETVSTQQESNENDRAVNDTQENLMEKAMEVIEVIEKNINEQEKRLSKDTNESSVENLIASEASQHDATKETNQASNLSAAEHAVERDSQKQSTLIASNAEQKVQGTEKEKTSIVESSSEHQLKSFTICACHRPKTSNELPKTDIEIVLKCTTCRTLFRRFECFEAHCTQQSAEGMLCNKNRKNGRKSKLFCIKCQRMMNSVQELWYHLRMHFQVNRASKVSFCCNICKVIFHGFGQLFISHFQNHTKNPFFLASCLSFPRPSYVGSKIFKLATDSDKSIEIYMHVADYVCPDCRTPFISPQALKSHKTVCPNITITSADPRNRVSDSRNSSPNKIQILLICGFCNKTFYSRMAFEVHSLEHLQKRNMHMHYTCVAVTAVTKVYICKVCTTMWQSLQNFEEHWQTHSILKEDYICSRCQNHYDSIELFQKHAIVHKNNNEMKQMPITCEVIYRDISNMISETQRDATADDLPYMDLSFFNNVSDFTEKFLSDKSRDLQEWIVILQNWMEKFLCGNQSTEEVIVPPELSVSSNKELQATSSQVPIQVSSSSVAVAQSKRNSNGNSRNDDSDEEEDLTIVLSESEESTVSSSVRKNAASMPSTQPTQETTKSTVTFDSVVIEQQIQCSTDETPTASITKTSKDVNESANSNARISIITPRESENTQLNTKARIDHANETLENCVNPLVSSDANSSNNELEKSLPKNAMSSVPRSFLRVKSLAELTDAPPLKNHFCRMCGLSCESWQKLKGHLSLCTYTMQLYHQGKKDDQASLSNNVQIWPAKPTNPPISMPSTENCPFPPLMIGNVSPSVSSSSNTSSQVSNTANLRPTYQVVGVKPLHSVECNNTIANVSKPKETLSPEVTHLSLNNVNATMQQKIARHQNLPPQIRPPLKKSAQSIQQQNPGTVAVRPFLHTFQPLRQMPPPYPQQQQSQQLQLQQSQQMPQQTQQLQLQLQQQSLQQQQQQQQVNINNIMQYLMSKTDMSYQLTSNNVVPTNNPDNVMLVAVNTMLQISKNPDRYICVSCPGFECGSVQEFTLHEHSPKHEARSNYNSITYIPQR